MPPPTAAASRPVVVDFDAHERVAARSCNWLLVRRSRTTTTRLPVATTCDYNTSSGKTFLRWRIGRRGGPDAQRSPSRGEGDTRAIEDVRLRPEDLSLTSGPLSPSITAAHPLYSLRYPLLHLRLYCYLLPPYSALCYPLPASVSSQRLEDRIDATFVVPNTSRRRRRRWRLALQRPTTYSCAQRIWTAAGSLSSSSDPLYLLHRSPLHPGPYCYLLPPYPLPRRPLTIFRVLAPADGSAPGSLASSA
ncbi:hypothetical protein C8R45DRAFT_118163 [Mycena sanguinolenta]|nr:hypothetical protein C8R45DRAFT_118163 [Mycena sanguinolenta]